MGAVYRVSPPHTIKKLSFSTSRGKEGNATDIVFSTFFNENELVFDIGTGNTNVITDKIRNYYKQSGIQADAVRLFGGELDESSARVRHAKPVKPANLGTAHIPNEGLKQMQNETGAVDDEIPPGDSQNAAPNDSAGSSPKRARARISSKRASRTGLGNLLTLFHSVPTAKRGVPVARLELEQLEKLTGEMRQMLDAMTQMANTQREMADKDAAIANKDAEIARLRAMLEDR
jgi:hypothetical protein